jgi:hypothetical protein
MMAATRCLALCKKVNIPLIGEGFSLEIKVLVRVRFGSKTILVESFHGPIQKSCVPEKTFGTF